VKPILKLYKYESNSFSLVAIIDDYQQVSFEHNLYNAGAFTVTINYNIPNAKLFERGLFVQFGNSPYDFGEIITISNSIGSDGKGSEYINITGYDARYLFKRRVIKNLNSNDTWSMTAKGELCMRNLIADQCGVNAESKRQLPIANTIPLSADALGSVYSVSEAFTNLYEVLCTIATQSEIGWAVVFDGSALTLVVYQGENLASSVQFSTDFESLASGNFTDTSDSYANSVYIGGKGTGSERDIYEGEDGTPEGFNRFEAYDNQSSMTSEEEYEAEAESVLNQYAQTITMSGAGLAKCPYIFREQYNIGDIVRLAFSGKSADVQILSVTEQWSFNKYNLLFNFGKPVNTLNQQLNLILRKIQEASNKDSACQSVKWYDVNTEWEQDIADVTFGTLGFTGVSAPGGILFKIAYDADGTGCKTYNIYVKNLTGDTGVTLTTGVIGTTVATLPPGSYVTTATVDTDGNVIVASVTSAAHADYSESTNTTDEVTSGDDLPVTSDAVFESVSTKSHSGICTTGKISSVKIVDIDDFQLKEGVKVTVMFTNGNSQSLPSLNVSGTGAKVIQVIRGGQKVMPELKYGVWRNDSTYSDEMWQPYTILDFIYDGTNWVICGNPVVESYYSGSSGYNVYADGKIELWDWYYTSTPLTTVNYEGVNYNNSVLFKIRFSNIPSMTTTCKSTSSNEVSYNEWLYPSTPVCFTRNRGKSYDFDSPWIAVGY
jgi:hypothetical protein